MNILDRLARLATFICLATTAALLVRPNGLVTTRVAAWRAQSAQVHYVRQNWDSLRDGALVHGSEMSKDRIVEFLDYQCVYCRAFEDSADALLRTHPAAAIVIRHLPNPANALSRSAALSAICADELGRMEAMHRYLLTTNEWRISPAWTEIAARVGIADTARFRRCLNSPRTIGRRSSDSAYAAALNIRGTPALVAPSRGVHLGVASVALMEQWIK